MDNKIDIIRTVAKKLPLYLCTDIKKIKIKNRSYCLVSPNLCVIILLF